MSTINETCFCGSIFTTNLGSFGSSGGSVEVRRAAREWRRGHKHPEAKIGDVTQHLVQLRSNAALAVEAERDFDLIAARAARTKVDLLDQILDWIEAKS